MAIAVLVVIGDANDEGRRPAGQYPIGDQGGGADVLQSREMVQPASQCPLDSGIRRGGQLPLPRGTTA